MCQRENRKLEVREVGVPWRAHPVVLAVRWRVYAAAGKLADAAMIAEAALMLLPPEARAEAVYDLALCACRVKRPEEARRWLAESFEVRGRRQGDEPAGDARLEDGAG